MEGLAGRPSGVPGLESSGDTPSPRTRLTTCGRGMFARVSFPSVFAIAWLPGTGGGSDMTMSPGREGRVAAAGDDERAKEAGFLGVLLPFSETVG